MMPVPLDDACSADPYLALLRFHHTDAIEIGSDEIDTAVVDAPNSSLRGHSYVYIAGFVLSDGEDGALRKRHGVDEPVAVQPVKAHVGGDPDTAGVIFKRRDGVIARQALRCVVIANLPVPDARHAVVRSQPDGAVPCGDQAPHNIAREPLTFRELREVPVPKTEGATAPRRNPQVAIRVFGQRPDATIEKAILLVVCLEALPVETRYSAAIRATPKRAIRRRQDGHDHIVRQAVGFCEHPDCAVLQSIESVPVCANP